MKELMDQETLKKLHNTQQEILDEFVKVCENNNLQYFLIGGTLLGAVRHKGFIPWDDDLDVAMTRKEYNKFLEIAEKEISPKYMIDNINTNSKYYLSFTKIRNKNTIFEQDVQVKYDGPKGVWIDIFPLDETKNINSKITFIQKKIGATLARLVLYKNYVIMGKLKPLKWLIGRFIFLKNKTIINWIDKIYQLQNDKQQNEYVINFPSAYTIKRETNEKINYFPASKVEFEGKMYNAPKDYDKVLKRVFGNYMELPPEEQRITHNPVRLEL